jgi:putative transposase
MGKRSGYPRFKRRHARQSAQFTKSAFRWDPEQRALVLAKMAESLDIHWSRDLPEGAIPSTVTVSLDTAGRWFVSLLVETSIEQLEPADRSVGIDLGANDLAVLSTGEKIAPARMTRTEEFLLRRAQKAVSRRVKGSKNREKAKREVARIHARVADRRRHQLHELSTRLVRENQTIVIEDLAVKPMMADGKGRSKTGLNRAIAQASMAELRSMLEYKCEWYGRELVVIDQWFPSTQLCSTCSAQTGPKGFTGLASRVWTCGSCSTTHDRDTNAANNILAAGLAASVCGDGRSLAHA